MQPLLLVLQKSPLAMEELEPSILEELELPPPLEEPDSPVPLDELEPATEELEPIAAEELDIGILSSQESATTDPAMLRHWYIKETGQ